MASTQQRHGSATTSASATRSSPAASPEEAGCLRLDRYLLHEQGRGHGPLIHRTPVPEPPSIAESSDKSLKILPLRDAVTVRETLLALETRPWTTQRVGEERHDHYHYLQSSWHPLEEPPLALQLTMQVS